MTNGSPKRRKKSDLPVANVRGEFFVHRYLWLGAETLRATGKSAAEGSAFPGLAALVLMYFALEGFLNDIGSRAYPEVWSNERDFFGRNPYRGTIGKLDFLLSRLKLSFDKGARPYQTVVELDRRRDSLVHPFTENISQEVRLKTPGYVPPIEPEVFAVASDEFLNRAERDLQEVCDGIQAAAYAEHGPGVVLGERAFLGSIGYQSTWLPSETEPGLSTDAT